MPISAAQPSSSHTDTVTHRLGSFLSKMYVTGTSVMSGQNITDALRDRYSSSVVSTNSTERPASILGDLNDRQADYLNPAGRLAELVDE
ncbi:hypothetical protein [Sedimenticola selenatireducens]|uniref:hypothetical protein n=1 Tax=Sedimenticola selenatireducens TaxID=191960 RepID=UPI002AAC2F52|nr:hypothetical protein [Sedimenticola selenatireducens]